MTPQEQEYFFDEESAHISRNDQDEINADAENLKTLYRLIPLTQGQWAVVDAADYDWLMQWKWQARFAVHTQTYYAIRTHRSEGEKYSVFMHRAVMGLKYKDGLIVDHRNHDTIDNCRENLCVVTPEENARNKSAQRNNTSGFTGVSFHKRIGKFMAYISVCGKIHHLGYYDTAEEAYAAYCEASKRLHGDFGSLRPQQKGGLPPVSMATRRLWATA